MTTDNDKLRTQTITRFRKAYLAGCKHSTDFNEVTEADSILSLLQAALDEKDREIAKLKEAIALKDNNTVQLLKRIDELKADSQKRVEGIFRVGDEFIEMLDHADFSNGNTANGMDEGDVLAYRIIKDLKNKWQALKAREGVK